MLKVAYERYFNGVDRVPPARVHDRVKRHVRNIQRIRGGSTQLRFRSQGLKARLITYEQYWTRILRQIEKGTFKRLLAESKRREYEYQARKAEEAGAKAAQSGIRAKIEAENEAEQSSATLRRQPPRRPSSSGPSKRAQLPDGIDARAARDLFKQFVAAKKAAGEPVKGLTYGKLVNKLARDVPKLQEKHGGEIRFEVATVNGKVRLRARRGAQAKQAGAKASASKRPSLPSAKPKPGRKSVGPPPSRPKPPKAKKVG